MIPFCLFSVICITKTIGFFLFIFPKSVNHNMMLNMSFPNNTSSAILIYICPQIPTFHPHFGKFFFILILFPPFSSFFFFIFYPLLLEKCHTHAHTHITNTLILKSWFYPILLPFHFPNSVIYSIVQAQSLRILLNTSHWSVFKSYWFHLPNVPQIYLFSSTFFFPTTLIQASIISHLYSSFLIDLTTFTVVLLVYSPCSQSDL